MVDLTRRVRRVGRARCFGSVRLQPDRISNAARQQSSAAFLRAQAPAELPVKGGPFAIHTRTVVISADEQELVNATTGERAPKAKTCTSVQS